MSRIDIERQKELEPKRMEFAKNAIIKLGLEIVSENQTTIVFIFNKEKITLFPYSGYHSGKSITDGRGIEKLIKQLKQI